ncbi:MULTISPECIES: hypothetical protein [Sphingobacterium]|uniref:hypothetical protein n=1 Tax=Sphingobacterium TaxID=28453 RepID=UPI00258082FB|nr:MULTISPECIES: hypothetical protein [Sphingobacterium]
MEPRKIKFKLSWDELKEWGGIMEKTFNPLHYKQKGPYERITGLLLSKLNETLRVKWATVEQVNKIDIPTEQGLAFLIHIDKLKAIAWPSETNLAINKIIGIIDHKTK